MIHRILILVCFFFCNYPFIANAQDSLLTLTQCIAIAIENNPNLQRMALQTQRSKQLHSQAWMALLPSLQGHLDHGINQGRSIDPTTNQFIEESITAGSQSLSSNLNLFSGMYGFHSIRKQALALKASSLEQRGAVEALKLAVIEAYITVLTAQDLLKQANNFLEVTKAQVERAEVLQEQGEINPNDFYDLKGHLASDRNAEILAKKNVDLSRLRLSTLLNLPLEDLPSIVPILEVPRVRIGDANQLYLKARHALPRMQALLIREQEATQGIKAQRAAYFPSLSLNGGLGSRYSNANPISYGDQLRNNLGKYLSLNLHIPLFNRFQVRNQVALAKIELEDVQWQRKIAEQELREKTHLAVFDLNAAFETVENLAQQVEYFRESFRVAQVLFDEGVSNSVLFLTAKSKYDGASHQWVVKRYEWILQKFINDYYAGDLE